LHFLFLNQFYFLIHYSFYFDLNWMMCPLLDDSDLYKSPLRHLWVGISPFLSVSKIFWQRLHINFANILSPSSLVQFGIFSNLNYIKKNSFKKLTMVSIPKPIKEALTTISLRFLEFSSILSSIGKTGTCLKSSHWPLQFKIPQGGSSFLDF